MLRTPARASACLAFALTACAGAPRSPETAAAPDTAATVAAAAAPAPAIATPPAPPPDAPAPDPSGAWSMRIVRQVWWPTLVNGSFVLERDAQTGKWRGDVMFDQLGYSGPQPLASVEVLPGRIRMTIDAGGVDTYSIDADLRESEIEGTMRWSDREGRVFEEAFRAERRAVPRFESDGRSDAFPAADDPAAVGLIPLQLERLLLLAQDSDSDAFIVVKDGKLVCERYFGRARTPIEIHSITKAIASLAVPFLLEEKRIASIDEPMSRVLTEWAGDDRSTITLRDVLTHTSGLDVRRGDNLLRQQKVFEYALATPSAHARGTSAEYSNVAFETLGGYVQRLTGERIDTYLDERLFHPVGIAKLRWKTDETGIPTTWMGIEAQPMDLARIGWTLAQGGVWQDKRVIPEGWCDALVAPGSPVNPRVGLTWWRRFETTGAVVQTKRSRDALAASGFAYAAKLAPLDDVRFASSVRYWADVRARNLLTPDQMRTLPTGEDMRPEPYEFVDPAIGFFHQGSNGQHLLVYPRWHLVVVHLVTYRRWLEDPYTAERLGFRRLQEATEAMVVR